MTSSGRDLSAVIVAAGRSQRFGGKDKLLEMLDGESVLARSVGAFVDHSAVCEIVVVLNQESIETCDELLAPLRDLGNLRTCCGGRTRRESVRAGIAHLKDAAPLVAIHDAARPLVDCDLIDRVLDAARRVGAAVPVTPIADTIFEVSDGTICGVVPRDGLRAAQTPQIFRTDWLADALDRVGDGTDEASALFQCGYQIELVEGSPANLKITWPEDIALAAALLNEPSR